MSTETEKNVLISSKQDELAAKQRAASERSDLNDSFKQMIDFSDKLSPKLCESSVYTKRQELSSDIRNETVGRPKVSHFEEHLKKSEAELQKPKLQITKGSYDKQQSSKVFRNLQIQASDHILIKNREVISTEETPLLKHHKKRPKPTHLSLSDKIELSRGFDRSKFIWIVQRLFTARTKVAFKEVRGFAETRKLSPVLGEAQKGKPLVLSKETFVEPDLLVSTGENLPLQQVHRSALLQSTKQLFDSAQHLKQYMSVLQTSAAFSPEQVYSGHKLHSDLSIEKYRDASHLSKFDLPISYHNAKGLLEPAEEKPTSPFSERANLAPQPHELDRKKFLHASEAPVNSYFAMPKPLHPPKLNFGSRSTSVAQMTANHYKKLTDSLTSSQIPSLSYINPLFGRRDPNTELHSLSRSPPVQDRTPASKDTPGKKHSTKEAALAKTEPAKRGVNMKQVKAQFQFVPKPPPSKARKQSWSRPKDKETLGSGYEQFQQVLSTLASKTSQ